MQTRKERRKAEQYTLASKQIKKGTTIIGSAMMVSSIAAPVVMAPRVVEATEGDIASAEISNTTHSEAVTQNETTANTSDSTTLNSTIESSATETTASSEVDNSTESSTSDNQESSSEEESADSPMAATFSGPRTRSVNAGAFLAEIAGYAQPVAAANDLYASVMMAQAIIESGWGASTLSQAPNYNLFGIKGSYQGQSVYMDTWEYLNGKWVIKKEPFRKYPSYQQSFNDNAYVLKNTSFQAGVYYYSGAWRSKTSSYKDATAWLTGRYATDPSYGTKLNNIIAAYNLSKYDSPSSGGGSTIIGDAGGAEINPGGDGNSNTQNVTHTVKSGDSLWALASKYNTSVVNIKSWNSLSSDMIYVGQKLIVRKGSGGNSGGSSTTDNGSTGNNGGATGGGSTSTTNTYYTVKSGDSLWAIANSNGISIANLRQWNNLSGDVIHPGQRLVVKQGNSTGGSSTTGNGSNENSGGATGGGSTSTTNAYYTVKSGDSLWAIANSNGISIANLRQWNSLSGDMIFPGQRLIVKQGGNTGGSTTGGGSTGNTGGSGGSTSNGTSNYHTVKSGDSLWAIANQYGVSITNLRQWNNLSGDVIHPGQRLVVKNGTTGGSSTSGSTGSNNSGGSTATGTYYTVKSGDSLWAIANANDISITSLRQWNNLSGDVIQPGQRLVVKQGGSSSSSTNTSNSNSSSQTGKTHTVKSGDTLWDLAKAYGSSIQAIKQKNNLSSDIIYVGQKLKV